MINNKFKQKFLNIYLAINTFEKALNLLKITSVLSTYLSKGCCLTQDNVKSIAETNWILFYGDILITNYSAGISSFVTIKMFDMFHAPLWIPSYSNAI